MPSWKRRYFLQSGLLGAGASVITPSVLSAFLKNITMDDRLKISLAQWSLHRTIFGGKMNHLEFAAAAAQIFDIYAVEYVNQFFKDKATDLTYLEEMNRRAGDAGVTQLLIMIDGEGGLAEPDDQLRKTSVHNHHKWVDAAAVLGCHSIRVNAYGDSKDARTLHAAAVDGLGKLATYASGAGINVIVENHGGWSSDGQWLSGVMKEINMPNCGTLPDFGNFCLEHGTDAAGKSGCLKSYDAYKGVEELLPFAKAVSAKSYDFDAQGNETKIDYSRMMTMIKASYYEGYLGIEYEGSGLDEFEGIRATKKLLERLL